jgi:hypothetical protein
VLLLLMATALRLLLPHVPACSCLKHFLLSPRLLLLLLLLWDS